MGQLLLLNTRSLVITGGAAGIGRAVACMCAARGDRVIKLDRDESAAEQTSYDAPKLGAAGSIGWVCDVRYEDQVGRPREKVAARFGVPGAMFADDGIDIGGFIHEMPLEI